MILNFKNFKVALNSRPNAYAMFFGEQAYQIEPNSFNNYTENKGRDKEKLCKTELETLNFIGFDFRNQAFRTLMTEDWSSGVFSMLL